MLMRCKVSDWHNWVPDVFHQRNRFNFESNRMRKNLLLRLINARLDQSHTLHIVSQSILAHFSALWSMSVWIRSSHHKIFHLITIIGGIQSCWLQLWPKQCSPSDSGQRSGGATGLRVRGWKQDWKIAETSWHQEPRLTLPTISPLSQNPNQSLPVTNCWEWRSRSRS